MTANDTINVALIGCRSMGWADLTAMLQNPGVRLVALCDVDQEVLDKRTADAEKNWGVRPRQYRDYRQVLDNKDIDRIAKLLQLKSWREDDSKIHVDSLDVAMTVFRKELEVYPFLLSLHKYNIVAEGRHNLSNSYDYHVEIVQSPLPVRLAVDVQGTMPKLNFAVSPKLRYKNLYRPAKRSDVDNEVLRLKKMIRESLEANVKESTREYEGLGEENSD